MKNNICVCFLLLISNLVYSQNLTDGLLLYYPFESEAIDISGNGLDAELEGTQLVNGRSEDAGNARYFDGIDDFVALPNSAILKPDFPVTISFWVKTESLEQARNKFVQLIFKVIIMQDFGLLLQQMVWDR